MSQVYSHPFSNNRGETQREINLKASYSGVIAVKTHIVWKHYSPAVKTINKSPDSQYLLYKCTVTNKTRVNISN